MVLLEAEHEPAWVWKTPMAHSLGGGGDSHVSTALSPRSHNEGQSKIPAWLWQNEKSGH